MSQYHLSTHDSTTTVWCVCVCMHTHMHRKIFKDLVNNKWESEEEHHVREDWNALWVWGDHTEFKI
jgi:hypothetical protein